MRTEAAQLALFDGSVPGRLRPPTRYYGSKVRLAPAIARMLPKHRVYVEPYAGSLAVLFAKEPVPHEVVNDRDDNVVHFLRTLRDDPERLARACRLTPHARSEYELAMHGGEVDDPVERARRWWVRVNQGFNGGAFRVGWSVSVKQGSNRARASAAVADRLEACAERLRTVAIECRPALEVIERFAVPGAVVYLDPPYVRSSRAATKTRSRDYTYEMSDDDHRELAALVRAKQDVAFILSGYACPLYDELYGDWWRWDIGMDRPSTRGTATGTSGAVEVLWANRPILPAPARPAPAVSHPRAKVTR